MVSTNDSSSEPTCKCYHKTKFKYMQFGIMHKKAQMMISWNQSIFKFMNDHSHWKAMLQQKHLI